MTRRIIGPQMQRAASIVAANPGCSMRFVAERISPHPYPWRNWALGYNPVHRAISAGLIIAKSGKGRAYALFPPEPQLVLPTLSEYLDKNFPHLSLTVKHPYSRKTPNVPTNLRIEERGNGFPRIGDFVEADDSPYRLTAFVGPIHTDMPGRGNYVYATGELVEWADVKSLSDVRVTRAL